MKKSFLVYFILALQLVYVNESLSIDRIEFAGEADFNLNLYQKPSSHSNKSEFDIPVVLLKIGAPVQEKVELEWLFRAAPKRDTDSGQYAILLDESYAVFRGVTEPDSEVKWGLIPNFLRPREIQNWDFQYLGDMALPFSERYGYLSSADMGISYGRSWNEGKAKLGIALVNGEGKNSAESGQSKDTHLWLQYQLSQVMFSLMVHTGLHDGFDPENNKKERFWLFVNYENEFVNVGLEGMMSRDPVDAIDGKVADSADLSSHGGLVANGRGVSAWMRLALKSLSSHAKWENIGLIIRSDYIDPKFDSSGLSLRQQMFGFEHRFSEKLKFSLLGTAVEYNEGHGSAARETQKIIVGSQIVF